MIVKLYRSDLKSNVKKLLFWSVLIRSERISYRGHHLFFFLVFKDKIDEEMSNYEILISR